MILFLAANPPGTSPLALDAEARAIHVELTRSGFRDRFELVTRWATESEDLLRELRELAPTVVHFSGHCHPAEAVESSPGRRDVEFTAGPNGERLSGLSFHSPTGGEQVVSAAAIADTFAALPSRVAVVVLNACFTAPVAEALLAHVDCVVGMTGAIHDAAARSFAVGFYGGLGAQASIAAAFEQGRATIGLDGLPDTDLPRLMARAGFDPARLILAAVAPSARVELPCPYPGMRAFTESDAWRYHGRDAEIGELIARLRAGEREIYVIGPSGSGKSSLVAAGLLPRLARGVAGLGPCVVRSLRPGEAPAARLREAVPPHEIASLLAGRGDDAWLLIVIDQLEEVFTLARADERAAFLAAVCALRREPRCAVIVTLRADFFGALMESPLWPERGRDQLSRVEVSPLRGEALRDAISEPARHVGATVDPDLLERLLADAASEPGTLPLLQETLVQLWNERTDQTLTLADYAALGEGDRSGLAVALARRGDATMRRFDARQAAIARRILVRLISFGEGRSDTRRQQPRAQLRAAGDCEADFSFVLQTMIEDRLLTIDDDPAGEPRVDLAHESMISAWPTLADWIRSHRADEQHRRQIEAAAAEWAAHGRTARGLLDAIELADAVQWQGTESAIQLGHSEQVTALIAASADAVHRRRRRRLRWVLGAFSVLWVFAVVVGVLAFVAHRRAAEVKLQLARLDMEQGRQLVVDGHYDEAMLYLLQARKIGLDSLPLRMLFHTAKVHLPLVPPLAHREAVKTAVFSPDGTRVVTASWDKTARLWDAVTGAPIGWPLVHRGAVWSAVFSPDGTRVVTASDDATARVWNAATGHPITKSLVHDKGVTGAAFSPDGTRVVTASADGTARIWDAATGAMITPPLAHPGIVISAVFSPDGKRIVTACADGAARVWDATSGKLIAGPLEHQAVVESAVFSPDGARIVTASDDHTARVWDAATGKPIGGPLAHQAPVTSAVFSPDGARVLTASRDSTAQVWDVASGQPIGSPLEHQAPVTSAVFSPDGTRVLTASRDKTAQVWDAETGHPVTSVLEHQAVVESAVFSADGTRVVTASRDKAARVWDAATGALITGRLGSESVVEDAAFNADASRLVTASWDTAWVWNTATGQRVVGPLALRGSSTSVAFSPDGTRVVTGSWSHAAQIWNAATGVAVTPPLLHRDAVRSAVFSADGTRVVTASNDRTARVWDAKTGAAIGTPLTHEAAVVSAAFSPDGTRVVTASEDNTARVWSAVTGAAITEPLRHHGAVVRAVFSPDGTRVVTASEDNTARVWNAATGRPITVPLAHQGQVVSAVFSPDGTRVVTASWDKTARVWDAATGKPLTGPLAHQDQVVSAVFSPDGTRVITASRDSTVRVWDAVAEAGTLEDWSQIANRSQFVLGSGMR